VAPVDERLGFLYFRRVAHAFGRLRLCSEGPGDDAVDGLQQGRGAELGQRIVQVAGRFLAADGPAALQQHRPGVESLVELHDADTGHGVAGQQRALNRRRAAPARQQRTMDVEAAEPRQRQRRGGQDQSIRHDHHQVRRPFEQRAAPLGRAQAGGLRERQSALRGQ
jgi:hypothetical protein